MPQPTLSSSCGTSIIGTVNGHSSVTSTRRTSSAWPPTATTSLAVQKITASTFTTVDFQNHFSGSCCTEDLFLQVMFDKACKKHLGGTPLCRSHLMKQSTLGSRYPNRGGGVSVAELSQGLGIQIYCQFVRIPRPLG